MLRTVLLDQRLVRAQWLIGAPALLIVGLAGAEGNAFTGGIVPFLWIAMAGVAHRDLAAQGPVGVLQSVLGVPRRHAVLARYADLGLRAGLTLTVGLLASGRFLAAGEGWAQARGVLALVSAALCCSGMSIALGYLAPRTVQLSVTLVLYAGMFALVVLPGSYTDAAGVSTPGVDRLWVGPVPLVWTLVMTSAVVLGVGYQLASRAHARATF